MKKAIIFLLLIGTIVPVLAQQPTIQTVEVNGKVMDQETKQPLEYATIVLTPKNGGNVTGGLTDANGIFKVEAPKGIYDISVEYISFKSFKIASKNLDANFDMGTINLVMDGETLGEIELIAEKTTVEIKLDKKIYNVGKDLTVRGGTVSDVLDNVPSVSVDVEGNVALRGNDNVRILINGKPSGLVGLSSSEALRQLPADAIEKVEVITSPSARYDAEGTGGILNIILRRSKLQGLNGAITTTLGHPTSAGISGNLNYRTGDFNFFTTTGYNYRESPGNSYASTNYLTTNSFLEENRDYERIRKGLNANVGLEWYITENTSITGAVFFRNSDNESNTINTIFQRDANGLETTTFRFDPEIEEDKTTQYSLNFDKKFKKDGEKLTAEFQYETSGEDEFSLISQNNILEERVSTIEDQKRILLQADYVLPIKENSQFELGYRGSFNDLNTDYEVETKDEFGNFMIDPVSNFLKYQEDINAVYSQYGTKFNKFSVLLGLRMENTKIIIDQVASNDYSEKNYTGLFPTINLGYEIDENQNLTLGYNRRLRRPRSRFINPFPSRSSTTNIFQGNPDLDPTYSNGVDLGYLNRLGKLTINSSIYYTYSTDVFSFISEPTGETVELNGQQVPVIRRFPLNLASSDRYGFEFTLTFNPNKKWNINGNFNFFGTSVKGNNTLGENLDNKNSSWSARLNNKYTLPGQVEWQTRMSYRGPSENAQNKSNGIFSTDLAFSKDLFKEKASLALSINDVFNSRKRISETNAPTFTGTSEFQWRQRSVNLSFTYRFNQKKKRQQQRQEFDGGEEGFGD